MLHHLSLGARDIEGAARFYDAVLAPLGYARVWSDLRPGEQEQAVGYGPPGSGDKLAIKQVAQAVPFYEAALALGLPPQSLRGAYLGLGSTYRTLGRYEQAEATLREGLAHFADAAELRTFLAMTLHNRGQSRQAVELLLGVVADTSADAHVAAYREAIRFYAQDVERTWT